MRHHILVKWKPEADKAALAEEAKMLFAEALQIPGIRGVSVHPNVIDRANRYDLLIVLHMPKEVLPAYDESPMHHRWKEQYGGLIEKKAIFDCDD